MTRGRKPLLAGQAMSRHVVSIDEMTLRKLKVLGDGNLSLAVRVAAQVAFDRYQNGAPLPIAEQGGSKARGNAG